jgi:hypothetical protein
VRSFRGLALFDHCAVVPVGDVVAALIELNFMSPEHQSYEDLDRGYRLWYGSAGLDPFAAGPIDALIELTGPSEVTICPASAWQVLSAQAAGRAAAEVVEAGEAFAPEPAPAPTLTPEPPAPAPRPRQRAGFTPESSPWAWLVVLGVVGATWLYVRYDRRTRGR